MVSDHLKADYFIYIRLAALKFNEFQCILIVIFCPLLLSLQLGFGQTLVKGFVMCLFCFAAVDDTQRMMQMGGFGFDPSKVQI